MTADKRRKRVTHIGCEPAGSRGFSLVELVVIVVIVAVISAIVIPRFSESAATQRIEAAARRVAADLALARNRAKMSSADVAVQFTAATATYTLPGIEDVDHPAQQYTVDLTVPPYEVGLAAADFGGDGEIIFNGYGEPDSGGSVTILSGDMKRIISVDPDTGLVTITEPAPVVFEELPPEPLPLDTTSPPEIPL